MKLYRQREWNPEHILSEAPNKTETETVNDTLNKS
jgi:hypothetical protein